MRLHPKYVELARADIDQTRIIADDPRHPQQYEGRKLLARKEAELASVLHGLKSGEYTLN
jgi:hypothetical protein